jgi:hypothetical protein
MLDSSLVADAAGKHGPYTETFERTQTGRATQAEGIHFRSSDSSEDELLDDNDDVEESECFLL